MWRWSLNNRVNSQQGASWLDRKVNPFTNFSVQASDWSTLLSPPGGLTRYISLPTFFCLFVFQKSCCCQTAAVSFGYNRLNSSCYRLLLSWLHLVKCWWESTGWLGCRNVMTQRFCQQALDLDRRAEMFSCYHGDRGELSVWNTNFVYENKCFSIVFPSGWKLVTSSWKPRVRVWSTAGNVRYCQFWHIGLSCHPVSFINWSTVGQLLVSTNWIFLKMISFVTVAMEQSIITIFITFTISSNN